MLVTLSADRFITLTLPAKVQSYMAAGKPIIAASNGEIPNVIKESGEFVINLASADLAKQVDYCGVKSGKLVDKFKECNFTKEQGTETSVPMIKECPISIECRVKEIKELGTHDMFMAEILAVNVDEKYLDETGRFDMRACNLLAYSHGHYYKLGEEIGKFGWSVRKNKKK